MDYGGTEFTVSRNLGIDKKEARKLIDKYYQGFSGLANYNKQQRKKGMRDGFVTTFMGHKRHVQGIYSDSMKIKSYYERICLNAPIQGAAADIVSTAQRLVDKDPVLNALGFYMLIQIHDEICGTCPKKFKNLILERVTYIMEHPIDLEKYPVHLKVAGDYAENYAAAK